MAYFLLCLKRESYNSKHSKTKEVFSDLIEGGARWLSKKIPSNNSLSACIS